MGNIISSAIEVFSKKADDDSYLTYILAMGIVMVNYRISDK